MEWIIVGLLLIVLLSGSSANRSITITHYDISTGKLPDDFTPMTIVQISDLHNASFGKDQADLVSAIQAQVPDLIVLTGDMVGNRDARYENALILIQEAAKLAPVIVVDGNHDAKQASYPTQKQAMIEAGAIVLEDASMPIVNNGKAFNLIGLKERFNIENRATPIVDQIDPDRFNLLLAHHPSDFMDYAMAGADLTLTGHAHGGQFRFFNIGIFAPDEGFFPSYDAGMYTLDHSSMIVSRGLGESILPLRLYNGPELVVITLSHQSK